MRALVGCSSHLNKYQYTFCVHSKQVQQPLVQSSNYIVNLFHGRIGRILFNKLVCKSCYDTRDVFGGKKKVGAIFRLCFMSSKTFTQLYFQQMHSNINSGTEHMRSVYNIGHHENAASDSLVVDCALVVVCGIKKLKSL